MSQDRVTHSVAYAKIIKMTLETPVTMLVYNRPDHTAKVFDVIRSIKPTELFIVADGPKDKADELNCMQTRQIFEHCDWPVNIHKNYSDVNMGVADRIISGLDWVFDQVEQAIILEDDCVPDPTFFKFCEELLDYYQDDERIAYINGCNLGQKIPSANSYAFTQFAMFWGWATWARAWQKHNHNLDTWQKHSAKLKNVVGTSNQILYELISGEIFAKRMTWDISWNADAWLNDALGIVPVKNLVKNIGFDNRSSNFKDPDSKFANLPTEAMKFPLKHPESKDTTANAVMEKAFFELLPESFPGLLGS